MTAPPGGQESRGSFAFAEGAEGESYLKSFPCLPRLDRLDRLDRFPDSLKCSLAFRRRGFLQFLRIKSAAGNIVTMHTANDSRSSKYH
jgi:hypothetical protein